MLLLLKLELKKIKGWEQRLTNKSQNPNHVGYKNRESHDGSYILYN